MSDTLPEDVQQALNNGNKIEAIKLLREQTGLGLKESKDWVEAVQAGRPRPEQHRPIERRASESNFLEGLLRLYRQVCFVLFVAFFWILLTPGLSFGDAGRWLDRQLDDVKAAIGLAQPEPPAH